MSGKIPPPPESLLPAVNSAENWVRLTPGARLDGRETIRIEDGDLVDDDLQDLILLSLFTWRRARDDDPVPDGASRQGFWADPEFGSRLWLLARAKSTQQTLVDAQAYAEEALQWLVDDQIVRAITVTVELAPRGDGAYLSIGVARPRQPYALARYAYFWGR